MKTIVTFTSFLLTTAGGLGSAWAVDSINFCFEYDTLYEDNGEAGEDYWLSDIERTSRGSRVSVTNGVDH